MNQSWEIHSHTAEAPESVRVKRGFISLAKWKKRQVAHTSSLFRDSVPELFPSCAPFIAIFAMSES